MRVTVTGATGLIGAKLVDALCTRGDEVTVLSRDPDRARARLGGAVRAVAWDPAAGPAPERALEGRDGVVHLAGEPVAQRWNDEVRARIRDSRATGTRNLVAGIAAAEPRPRVLVSASAVGYYGPHGDERVDEQTPAGSDFLAGVCVVWEREAEAAEQHGLRVARIRTGVVLDPDGGALAKMLPPFKLGAGGPVAGGKQYMPWIHADDLVGIYLAALDGDDWSGPFNGSAPEPVTNAAFSKALGRALHRPAVAPVPRVALKLLYGEMEQIVTTGQRAVPRRAQEQGHTWRHADLDAALRDAVG
ncbi:TIGR01777 family oxidoreductase [Conexibacter sp. JD483]|uniref:TIGR01777 family oxidoreductase n=1 Tax=unclassified Conexibacter TaxID=2627773 RepID=UPI0027280E04|nr:MULTISPECIES: TIGR01777 family oxidoreductase [unclassified Conexibacter]MDO8184815.1 TIGR01777 family oxidoreductase [Conexibacter sp. CPCC 205706]MDO8196590.1 TIGR01777 family oxidoreductase [Conexibacter sp. CPCC 205762]MDR9368697.1 TIGR01777 family oxidoreductase [Conexibacter sp. JD483]